MRARRGRSPTRAIEIVGRADVARSSADGSFVLRGLEPRDYVVRVRAFGFVARRSRRRASPTDASTTLDVALEPLADRARRRRRAAPRAIRRPRARPPSTARDRSVGTARSRRAAADGARCRDHAGGRPGLGESRLDSRIGRERSARARRRRADQLARSPARPTCRASRSRPSSAWSCAPARSRRDTADARWPASIEIDDAARRRARRRCSLAPARGASTSVGDARSAMVAPSARCAASGSLTGDYRTVRGDFPLRRSGAARRRHRASHQLATSRRDELLGASDASTATR